MVDQYNTRQPGLSSAIFGNNKMYGMTSVTDNCPLYSSECQINNGDCPANYLCLVNRQLPSGRACLCVDKSNCNEYSFDD